MLIVALVLAVIGLAALVTAVVTSNELIAWVCIAASVIGVVLLIVDALRDRSRGGAASADGDGVADDYPQDNYADDTYVEDYPDEAPVASGLASDGEPSDLASDGEPSDLASDGEPSDLASEPSISDDSVSPYVDAGEAPDDSGEDARRS
ncbi:phage holin family protein [Mycobacterium sp. SMC-4]|uniref:phage holin family protein n=1 Tax=Mycobacterium sp. SMC-4 TaxID=2857059 RepID=UPI0021B21EBF|nr:phage holin family protein [Mycobacterium sp. SMC-4]